MFKSLGFVLICITATLAGTGGYAAMNNNALQLGITIEYELPPF